MLHFFFLTTCEALLGNNDPHLKLIFVPEGLSAIVCNSTPISNKTSGATLYAAPLAQSKVTLILL